MGENISQAFQMVQSGAAEVGIVALSLALAPSVAAGRAATGKFRWTPIRACEQGGAILKWTQNLDAARAFRAS